MTTSACLPSDVPEPSGYHDLMRSHPLLLLSASVLTLSACIVRHGDRHGDDGPWRGEPGDRHSVEDTADTAAGTDTSEDTAADTAVDVDTAADTADTVTDTADTGTAPAWSLSSECRDAGLRLIGASTNMDPTSIAAGSSFALTVVMENASGADDLAYPGVLFSTDNAGVTSPGSDWRYAMFAGMTDELGTIFTVAPDLTLPATVTLTATTTRIGCEHGEVATPDGVACPAACTLSYPVTIVAAP